jgi:Ca2+-binding EF-hand superfamily protein
MKIQILTAALLFASAPLLAQTATPTQQARPQGMHQGGMHKGGMHRGGGIERLDTDKDGRISRAEFDAGRAQREARMAQDPERQARMQEHMQDHKPADFTAMDANRDGYLVASELRAYHERMRPQREAERTARFNKRFAQADLNRDGKLGRVEVQEKMPRLADRFAWLDENRDGFLSKAELEAAHKHR